MRFVVAFPEAECYVAKAEEEWGKGQQRILVAGLVRSILYAFWMRGCRAAAG